MERYVVSSVTGYSITQMGATARKPQTIWSVLDSGNCYLPVWRRSRGQRNCFGTQGEQNMRALAARLNAEDDEQA